MLHHQASAHQQYPFGGFYKGITFIAPADNMPAGPSCSAHSHCRTAAAKCPHLLSHTAKPLGAHVLPRRRRILARSQQQERQTANASAAPEQQPQHAVPVQQAGNLLQKSFAQPPVWPAFLGTLFQQGALLGPLLDGIHSRVHLQVYDVAPVTLGPLNTSLLVPPLLGTFYVVLGLLTVAADNNSGSSPATAAAQQRVAGTDTSVGVLALNFGSLAGALALSAALYESQQPPSVIFAVLAAVTAVNWAAFDRTTQGAALALVCGLGAPAAELVLMAVTHCWHYPKADVGGLFVSWVPLCYAFYTPAVSNLARYLWATCRPPSDTSERAGGM